MSCRLLHSSHESGIKFGRIITFHKVYCYLLNGSFQKHLPGVKANGSESFFYFSVYSDDFKVFLPMNPKPKLRSKDYREKIHRERFQLSWSQIFAKRDQATKQLQRKYESVDGRYFEGGSNNSMISSGKEKVMPRLSFWVSKKIPFPDEIGKVIRHESTRKGYCSPSKNLPVLSTTRPSSIGAAAVERKVRYGKKRGDPSGEGRARRIVVPIVAFDDDKTSRCSSTYSSRLARRKNTTTTTSFLDYFAGIVVLSLMSFYLLTNYNMKFIQSL